ncbi:MAG: pyruvate dehydrogenase (acetyl-transferring) E1 component subunit alpha [Microbacteriaceae bacterium]|nr:MAG: pyruvate dehydrogenase (acetyl-transferring) E1 component subunit alpha [Microbacteriaceae bacterium]
MPTRQETMIEALQLMRLSRAVDKFAVGLQRQGVFGTFGEARGQEATLAGAAFALNPAIDWIVPQYRELPALVRHGVPLSLLFQMYMYDPAGFTVPAGVNALCNQVSLAAQLPHAVGLAWGFKIQKLDGVVVAFVGDGGSSEGDFFEACNLAAVTKAPVVFVVQNNQWAISTPFSRQTAASSIADRGLGFGMPATSIDGNDFETVFDAVSNAVTRARAGGGPTLLECRTYRLGAHNTNDDASRYRDAEKHAAMERDDPIVRLEAILRAASLWDDDTAERDDVRIQDELQTALKWAQEQPAPQLDGVFNHVYANPPARFERQRQQFREQGAGVA